MLFPFLILRTEYFAKAELMLKLSVLTKHLRPMPFLLSGFKKWFGPAQYLRPGHPDYL